MSALLIAPPRHRDPTPTERDAIRSRVLRAFAHGYQDRCERTAQHLEDIADEIRRGRANALIMEEASRLVRMRARVAR
ncbi:MAG: hypothetical protein AB7I42_22795 [Bradyrhizobium sp.]|uniref:hypothetical protein n=1 Tax=Bradyrhizobium sp. TaxID=376 RepID=UPI003D133960